MLDFEKGSIIRKDVLHTMPQDAFCMELLSLASYLKVTGANDGRNTRNTADTAGWLHTWATLVGTYSRYLSIYMPKLC